MVRVRIEVMGSEQSSSGNGVERGNGVKGSYHSQFSQYKYVRSHAATFPSNVKRNGSAGAASSMFARRDQEDNEWNQYKGSTSGQVAPIHAAAIPAKSQGGYGFLLPRYRTILDVNIDTFEQKPWRHPGVDITDFFNYGFDEQSWKDYCNSVEQFRQKTSMLTRIPVHEFSKYNQACEAGSEREKVVQEAVAEETDQAGQGRTDSHACKIAARGSETVGTAKRQSNSG
ncbi:hypothetical protein L1049_017462 [Liquidambar formosana]|uniref:Pre-mRNA polyadenylation factor Fip1 domain-containing protein n=1 Tax=Liquidambar formosana TaxID=63359 RepID=A0AAP0S7Z9_LIQFO